MQIDDMQLVCDYILKESGYDYSILVIRNNRWCGSVAKMRKHQIIIAEFIFAHPEEVQLAEIIHESCHFLCSRGEHHGPQFRQKEIYWLSQFGLKPHFYKRAYYKQLETLNGNFIPTRDYNHYQIAASQHDKLKIAAKTIKKRHKIERIEL